MKTHINAIAPPEKRGGQRVAAWMLLVLGIFFILLLFIGLMAEPEPGEDDPRVAVIFVFGVPGVVSCAGAMLWLRNIKKRERKMLYRYQEKIVLGAAAANGGYITVAEIIHETPLSSAEVEETLSRLCGQSIAQPELLADGGVCYRFAGLLDERETPLY